MKIIRTDGTTCCSECGITKELVNCTVVDNVEKSSTFTQYCNFCLNKFEEDTENYEVIE